MKSISIGTGKPDHLEALEAVENRCFSVVRRSSRASLRRSLQSPSQQVWIAWGHLPGGGRQMAGVMTLHWRRLSVRIYSLAVMPAFRGAGIGRLLMERACREAARRGGCYLSLEADRRDRRLVDWYRRFGFDVVQILPDYYRPGRDAVRMRRPGGVGLGGARL